MRKTPVKGQPPAILTDFDLCVEAVSSQEVSITKDGEKQTMTAIEAVLQKQLITAASGSPHAQNQFLKNVRQTAETRRAVIDQEIEYWMGVKKNNQKIYAKYRAGNGHDPEIFPHPDDIRICYDTGVKINGPINRAEHQQMHKTLATIDAWLHQDALDRARTKRRKDLAIVPGDATSIATLYNLSLPKRVQLSDIELASRRIYLTHLPIRVLLKDTRSAWKSAGMNIPRGRYAPSQSFTLKLLNTVAEITRWRAKNHRNSGNLSEVVDAAVRKHMR